MKRVRNELEIFGEKIREYSRETPNRFLQINGTPRNMINRFHEYHSCDFPEIQEDKVNFTETIELMGGSPIKIFIRPEVAHKDAVVMLKSMIKKFEKQPEILMRLALRAEIEDDEPPF